MAYSKKNIEEKFNEICKLIAQEGMSLRSVLLSSDMPAAITFYKWLDKDENKAKQYTRACENRADYFADEILEISDEQNADTYVDDTGRVVTDGSVIQRSRLKVDTRKWLMSKMQPKKYGDKLDMSVNIDKIKPIETIRKSDKK